jgi:hypothetical protein
MHCSKGEIYAIFEVGVKALYHRGKFRHCTKGGVQALFKREFYARGIFLHCSKGS